MSASFLESVDLAPDDSIYILPILYSKDTRLSKVNLGIGSYQTAKGNPYVLNVVKKAEQLLIHCEDNKEYQAIEGHKGYIDESLKLILGQNFDRNKIFACQTIGGTGALNLIANFLSREISHHIYIPDPTWLNHHRIFSFAGLKVLQYPYYDKAKQTLAFSEMAACIKTMPPGSSILLHSCCQNPTGADLRYREWQEISKLLLAQRIFPIFDIAYQGFGEGFEKDAEPIRLFLAEGHEMLIANSYSKNLGLYGERAGLFALITQKEETAKNCASHIKQIIRSIYSSPPLHTARLVYTILSDPILKNEWFEEVKTMKSRIDAMRESLVKGLETEGCIQDFSHLNSEVGFFSLLGIDQEKTIRLREEKAIYLPPNGRINIAGLNLSNLDYVIKSICSVFK